MTTQALDPNVVAFTGAQRELLIDGEWVCASDGGTFVSTNPRTVSRSPCWPQVRRTMSTSPSPLRGARSEARGRAPAPRNGVS